MKITKVFLSKILTFAGIIFSIITAVVITSMVMKSFAMINYYCVFPNKFFGLDFKSLADCSTYVTIGSIIVVGLAVIIFILLLCAFLDFLGLLFISIRKEYLALRNFEKIINTNFYPQIIKNQNVFFIQLRCPKEFLFKSRIEYTVKFFKPIFKTMSQKKPKTRVEAAVIYTIQQSRNIITTSQYFHCIETIIRKNAVGLIPIFEIDPEEKIFYLLGKEGKPKQFWNSEPIPSLEFMSFSIGENDFEINISAKRFFHRRYVQKFKFSIEYNF